MRFLAYFRHRNETISISIAKEDTVIAQMVSDHVLMVPVAAIFDIAENSPDKLGLVITGTILTL